MDKSAIKNFAIQARIKLINQIRQKAYRLGFTADHIEQPLFYQDGFEIRGEHFKQYEIRQWKELEQRIKQNGFDQVIEETAYIWFNRLIAVRFMEVNDYLPVGVRVLSSQEPNKLEPDIIKEVLTIDLNLNLDVVFRLQDEHNTEELFKYIFVKQCNQLGRIMPVVFEKIADFTELLLPDGLLGEGSVIYDLTTMIDEADWKEQVEIIGWLYQYYISEKKAQVFADLKKNIKLTKETIPAATQLFTPDWIVKYLLENSLGRLWLESKPNPKLQAQWKYYLEEAEQELEVRAKLQQLKDANISPENIKLLDPCMGSGHMLVYAFDMLYEIYKSLGYPTRDIPKLILEKNLYGLDIDDRASQLAYFAVLMKARSCNRHIFRNKINLNLCVIQESNRLPKAEILEIIPKLVPASLWTNELKTDMECLLNSFYNAKEYGSIITVQPLDFDGIETVIEQIENSESVLNIFDAPYKDIMLNLLPVLVKQGRMLSQKYDVVVTNPPYKSKADLNPDLMKFLEVKYPDSKNDLFSVFVEQCNRLTRDAGFSALITQHSWMTLGTFEQFRKKCILKNVITSMAHMGIGAFGTDFGTTAFVSRRISLYHYKAIYIKLTSVLNLAEKEALFFDSRCRFTHRKQADYQLLPGVVIAYWLTDKVLNIFAQKMFLDTVLTTREGMTTGNNDQFLRLWHEVDINRTTILPNRTEKWFPYNKGGCYRKWYGNHEWVVNWGNDGAEIRNFKDKNTGRIRSHNYNGVFALKPGITWGEYSSRGASFRMSKTGFLFDTKGCKGFCEAEQQWYILGFLNSKVSLYFLEFLAGARDTKPGHVSKLPLLFPYKDQLKSKIDLLVKQNVSISQADWDSFETSWDFTCHPLLSYKAGTTSIKEAYTRWEALSETQFQQLKGNEKELNRIFIEIYGLGDELTPDVEDKDVTICKADRVREVKSFISYAVGCLFGRYSLDETGLVYAGGKFDLSCYKIFAANTDNVLPITDDEYFQDDITTKFVDFVKITFGEPSLEENLDFIAESLNRRGSETSRQAIRRYFVKEFYKDHVQIYQKRPIYWLFDAGKNDGFKALIYMHRYDSTTVAKVRIDYLHALQRKYEAELNNLELILDSNGSVHEKAQAKRKHEKLNKQLSECCQYDQVIAHAANQKISIDLDAGVKVNYQKFQGFEVPQAEGKKTIKADILARIKF